MEKIGRFIAMGSIMLVELMILPFLGYLYWTRQEWIVLLFLIIGCALVVFTLFISVLLFKKPKKEDKSKYCPYFIEKYDDISNPEYIDRSIK